MPHFIKTGYWDQLSKAPNGYLNLDQLYGGSAYSRQVLSFPVPNLGDTINITPTATDTIVVFEGVLTNDFTINVVASGNTPGDRMYIMLEGTNPTVTFTGDINVTQCGSTDNTYYPTDPVCLFQIYNGNLFIGVDNC